MPSCVLVYLLTSLRFNRIARIDPGLKATPNRGDMGVSVLCKDKRRTGAGMFIQSGTVSDDPLGLIEFQTCGICFDISQWNG